MRSGNIIGLVVLFLLLSACTKKTEYFEKINPNIAVAANTDGITKLSAGVQNLYISSNGVNRSFLIQLPAGFNENTTYPVVFAFHGVGESYLGWQQLIGSEVDSRGYIGIYPAAVADSNWYVNMGGTAKPQNDSGFVTTLITWLTTKTNVKTSRNRYFALGVGSGAAFCHYEALTTSYFAAIVPISGSLAKDMIAKATVNRQTPMLQIHGEADATIPYGGGTGALGLTWESAQSSVKLWAARNNCGNAPMPDTPFTGIKRYTYPEFVGASETTLYSLPGVTNVYASYDTEMLNDLIWNFFGRHW